MRDTLARARRIALLGELIASFEHLSDRADFIDRLRAGEAITEGTAELLRETYIQVVAQ